ncbi:MAG: NCS2 family permease [Negativicutes bacterium]|jgi:AGZA family xanthine/uracil permease-like MFS transporter
MDSFFKLRERGTSVSNEFLAGVTTFLTMAYTVVVIPTVLSTTGMDFNGVFLGTCLACIIGTLIMAIFANYPIVIGPGLGLNAYFAYSVVKGSGYEWQVALGAVFLAGIVFMLISLTRFRSILLDAIPESLKHAITAGIGLFVSFIGLQNAKIVVASPATLVTLGKLTEPMAFLTVIGLIISLVLMAYRVKAALVVGMATTSLFAYYKGLLVLPDQWLIMPGGLATTALQLNIAGVWQQGLWSVFFTFLLITLFDTTGTLLGIAEQAGLMKDGKLQWAQGAFMADATGTVVGSLLGTSPTTAYIESSSGVASGGRTGITAIAVAVLIGITMFFSPVAKMLSTVPAVTAPALIIVGFFMMAGLRDIDWQDLEEAFPAFLVVISMPLTYSIATGIGIGFIVYPLLKIVRGKAKAVHPILYLFMVLFLIQIVYVG